MYQGRRETLIPLPLSCLMAIISVTCDMLKCNHNYMWDPIEHIIKFPVSFFNHTSLMGLNSYVTWVENLVSDLHLSLPDLIHSSTCNISFEFRCVSSRLIFKSLISTFRFSLCLFFSPHTSYNSLSLSSWRAFGESSKSWTLEVETLQ